MKIAVVGAGLAGLASTWYLLQKNCDVTVFDRGGGASIASTGLLHPAPGKKAIASWQAKEGIEASIKLLEAASQHRTVFVKSGILRIAANDEQRKIFEGPSVVIPEGIAVYSRIYLEELWAICKGAKRVEGTVSSNDLKDFDATILACGAAALEWDECKHLPLKRTIGQCLICRWPEPLSMPILSDGHITPTEDPELCQVGSTYEHTAEPDPSKALQLLEKAALFHPPARDYKIVEIRSGVRISPKVGYQPIVEKVGPKTWVFTGLGSRGLLYHSLLANSLVENICSVSYHASQ